MNMYAIVESIYTRPWRIMLKFLPIFLFFHSPIFPFIQPIFLFNVPIFLEYASRETFFCITIILL